MTQPTPFGVRARLPWTYAIWDRCNCPGLAHSVLCTTDNLADITLMEASQEISRHVESIAQMTDENNAAAAETATSAARLEQLAISVKTSIAQFKV